MKTKIVPIQDTFVPYTIEIEVESIEDEAALKELFLNAGPVSHNLFRNKNLRLESILYSCLNMLHNQLVCK